MRSSKAIQILFALAASYVTNAQFGGGNFGGGGFGGGGMGGFGGGGMGGFGGGDMGGFGGGGMGGFGGGGMGGFGGGGMGGFGGGGMGGFGGGDMGGYGGGGGGGASEPVNGIDACKDVMGHEGSSKTTQGQNNQSVTGKIGSSGYHYEIWYQGGNNSMTYYDNGTFKASWSGTNDFLARVGLKYNEDKTHQQLGQIDAYFKWTKTGNAGGYNYIGIYGWTVDPLVEYYIVDDWYNKPGAYLGQRKGEFTVDGDTYEIYQNTRVQQPSIKGTSTFPQFFSVRRSARSCGHIDISAHFKKWESLGMKMGKMYEAKVLIEAGGGSGSFDVTYFKMTDGSSPKPTTTTTIPPPPRTTTTVTPPRTTVVAPPKSLPGSCSAKILAQGYKCCSANCTVVYTDDDGDWGVENNQWCGCGPSAKCSQKILAQGYKCCADPNCVIYYTDADGDWGVENDQWCGCGL